MVSPTWLLVAALFCNTARAITPTSNSTGAAQTCVPLDAPATPTGLTALPGDGNVTLTWAASAHKSCVDYYTVTYLSIGPQGAKGVITQAQTTKLNITLTGLENGVNHAFYVEAVNKKFNRTAPATTTSIPKGPCDPGMAAGAPQNLTAVADGPGIKICWKAPRPGGCVDQYRVAKKMLPLTEEEVQTSTWQYQQVSTAGCMSFPGLQDRRLYQFAVQSFNTRARAGAFATTQATVMRDWKCMAVNGFYPICKSAAGGNCNPMTCAEQVAAGQCNSPWLRTFESTTKTIIQYCAEICGCTVDVETVKQAIAPKVEKFDGPSKCAAANMSPDGCCKW